VGRLDEIIQRNRSPGRARRIAKGRRGMGLAGVVLFVVLLLLIFTDLATPPDVARTGTGTDPGSSQSIEAPARPARGERVNGVMLGPGPGAGSAPSSR
jgi:hypothetical protein